VLGALGGAASSGGSSTSTTANKEPWAAAQPWLKSNLGLGQQLQAQYAANPFSATQKQAYNNQNALTQGSAQNMNSLLQQMSNRTPYSRFNTQQQNMPPAAFQFNGAQLGFGAKPFGG
jgi:hypothetical protein